MKTTIITATYNSAASIADAARSVLSQTYKDIDYLIVDGASTDGTLGVVKGLEDPRIRIISEKDQGIYDALNKGLASAKGDIIGLVHSDDLLAAPGILAEIVAQVEAGADGVYGDLLYVGRENTEKVIRYWKSRPFSKKLLSQGWMPPHPTLFLKREVYEKHGVFNQDYSIAADYDLMLRIFSDPELKLNYLPKVITNMRVGGVSNRGFGNILHKSKEDFRVIRKNKIRFPVKVLALKNLSKIQQFLKK